MTVPVTASSGQGVGRTPYVLVATNPRDSDSFLVGEALERKGAYVELAHLSDFPTRSTASLYFGPNDDQADRWHLGSPARPSHLRRPDTIWWRRPGRPAVPEDVHPDDRKFLLQETTRFIVGLWHHLPPGTVYVNSPVHALAATRKPYQLRIAREVGFTIPPTLFSNDPTEIRAAVRSWGGRAIYKPFGSINNFWWDGEREKLLCLFTTAVEELSLPDDETLSLTPGIFQPLLPKAFELRVTIFGRSAFAAKIFSQDQKRSQIDWRNGQRSLKYEAIGIPSGLRKLCVSLLRRLGLLMGCFDFIVTPEGDIVFLEVNESGQFLWLEKPSGLPLLDAFSDFLLDPRAGFQWKPGSHSLQIQDVQANAAEKMARAAETHQLPALPDYLQAALSSGNAEQDGMEESYE